MLLGAIDGRVTGFQGGTVLDDGNESLAGKRISELPMKFPWESQKGSATGANPVPELLSPGPRCSLCQAPELCVSGPGALCVGPRRCIMVRVPALAVSGPGALCVGPELCIGALCRAPALSSLRRSLRPGGFCVGARRFLAPYVGARRSASASGPVSRPALSVISLSCSLCRLPALSVSQPGALFVGALRSLALPALSLCVGASALDHGLRAPADPRAVRGPQAHPSGLSGPLRQL